MRFGCARCATRWDGHLTCHCAMCHVTFTGIEAFDLHRRTRCALSGLEMDGRRPYGCYRRARSRVARTFLTADHRAPRVMTPAGVGSAPERNRVNA